MSPPLPDQHIDPLAIAQDCDLPATDRGTQDLHKVFDEQRFLVIHPKDHITSREPKAHRSLRGSDLHDNNALFHGMQSILLNHSGRSIRHLHTT